MTDQELFHVLLEHFTTTDSLFISQNEDVVVECENKLVHLENTIKKEIERRANEKNESNTTTTYYHLQSRSS